MKVAYLLESTNAREILEHMIIPQMEEGRHGVEVAGMMFFFDNCISYAHPDETIRDILNEELSVYRAGVRTLEETTKIIDSRVWIYLNE